MKTHYLLPLVLLTGCGTTQPPPIVETQVPIQESQIAGTALDMKNTENIRYSEQLKAYPVGRYEDAAGNMHESHTLYRAEESPRWNLHPNVPVAVPMGPVIAVADPARQTVALTGELEQKITQQNQLLQATIEQNDRLGAEIAKMQTEVGKEKDAVLVNAELQKKIIEKETQLEETRKRLDDLEAAAAALKKKAEAPKSPQQAPPTQKQWWRFWR